jgi:Ca2+-binding EF-hand superfamily protein
VKHSEISSGASRHYPVLDAALMTQLNGNKPISDRELVDAMRALDSDGDGRVTFAEFSHAMKEWMGATGTSVT